jgi:hypothetical protein
MAVLANARIALFVPQVIPRIERLDWASVKRAGIPTPQEQIRAERTRGGATRAVDRPLARSNLAGECDSDREPPEVGRRGLAARNARWIEIILAEIDHSPDDRGRGLPAAPTGYISWPSPEPVRMYWGRVVEFLRKFANSRFRRPALGRY